ncbi:MAG: PP2C family protein-serine/threonine phosphatase [Phycisphaerales bacterium JB063]
MGQLLLIRDTDAEPASQTVPAGVEHVLSLWRGDDPPRVRTATLHEVLADPAMLTAVEAAWLMLDRPASGDLFAIVGELQERQVPALLTRPNSGEQLGQTYQDGIIACPPGTEPEQACVALQALVSQAPVVALLRRERRMLRAQNAGLCEQIGKLDEELRMAAQLQREFLPAKLPEVGDVSFHVLYRPAGYVSGDIYDVMRLDENHLGFFVADAVGHGVPAALMTIYIKRSLRSKRIDPDAPNGYTLLSPGEAMANLNADMIATQSGKVRFATACYGVLDIRTLKLTICRAGHPFPMLLRDDDEVQTLEPEGGLLGVFPDEVFEEHVVQLQRGDRLLLYSDGFECAFPDDEPGKNGKRKVANENYAQEFLDLGNGDPSQAIGRLENKLDTQAGSLNQKDDLTIVCLSIKREAGEETAQGESENASATATDSQSRKAKPNAA